MSEWEPVEVTVEVGGQEPVAGTLWVHERGGQTASFRYTDSYLTSPDGYALDPVLPKAAGVFHTPPGSAMFSAFADSAPDRWGENLMRREERERARLGGGTAAARPAGRHFRRRVGTGSESPQISGYREPRSVGWPTPTKPISVVSHVL